MLDFGFTELLLIIIVGVLVIGPKDIPGVMHGLGRIVRRLQYVRFALSRQFEDFMKAQDLDEIRQQVNFEEKSFNEAEADEDIDLPENALAPETERGTLS